MPRTNLASMSVDALLKLRDDIGDVLSRKASELKRQLSRLAGTASAKRGPKPRKSSRAGRKVAPKYRGARGETWSGRGLRPRWLTAALKEGHKLDDFLINKERKSGRRKKAA
jgi:DNA-binding protein H-NS